MELTRRDALAAAVLPLLYAITGKAQGPQSTGLAAGVEAHFLAVGQYGAFEPDDLLAVGELIADARDHVAGLHRRLGPAVGLHPVDGGATDQPFLLQAVTGLNLQGYHRVRICPHELDDRALYCHKLVIAQRP